MTAPQDRHEQLQQLEVAIDRLLWHVEDPWRGLFEAARARVHELRAAESLSDSDLSALSTSITALFDPKDAGLAWPPAATHEEFQARSAVFECALDLRVIGY